MMLEYSLIALLSPLFGGIMADISRHAFEDIMTVQIISWTSVIVGAIGLSRIVWNKVNK